MGGWQALPRSGEVFSLDGEAYRLSSHLLTVEPFELTAKKEERGGAAFRTVVDSRGPYVLRVINGDRAGGKRVESGTITLNDVIVVAPSQLSKQTEFLEVFLDSLPVENVLMVSLTGSAGAELTITVADSTRRK